MNLDTTNLRRSRLTRPRDIIPLLRRHRGIGIAVAVVTLFIATWAFLLMPRRYESTAQVLVRVGRESVRPDPTVTLGPMLGVTQSRLNELNSESTILRSHDLLQDVARAMYATPEARGSALDRLERNLRVDLEADSNIITVRYRARSPEHAKRTLDRVLELYVEKHLRSHRTNGSEAFFRRRSEEIATRIEDLRAELQERIGSVGAQSIDEHRQALLARFESLSRERADTASARAVATARLKQIDEGISGLATMQVLEEADSPGTARTEFERHLAKLRLEEQKLAANYAPTTSVMRDLREQIELAQRALDGGAKDRVLVRRGINANRQRLELERLTERTALAGLEARALALEKEHEAVKAQLEVVRSNEGAFAALRSQLTVLENERQRYLSGLEQARADSAMTAAKISNISIVQSPTLATRPAGPPRIWIPLVGAIMALVGGLGAVLLVDFFDPSLQLPSDVATRLDQDVLAAIPEDEGLRAPMDGSYEPGRAFTLPARTRGELGFLVGHLASSNETMIVGVTAPERNAGTSTVAFHLARQLAEGSAGKVLLVDACDGPSNLTAAFGIPRSNRIHDVGIPGLAFLPRWQANGDIRATLAKSRNELEGVRFVVLDLPALTDSAASLQLARQVDGTLLVLSPNTDVDAARRSLRLLASNRIALIGTALNRQELQLGVQA